MTDEPAGGGTAMRDLLAELWRQTTIAIDVSSLDWVHTADTEEPDKPLRIRQQLQGPFSIQKRLLSSDLLVDSAAGADLIKVTALKGLITIHFLEPAELESPGFLLLQPGRTATQFSLHLFLFLPIRLFEITKDARAIVCTVKGVERQNPESEFGHFIWRDAPRKPLNVISAQFAKAFPAVD